MPQVSVIIPTYNAARYLKEAVDSVLAQSFKDFEVLVIDDGSTDDTEALMRQYATTPVRYIRQENAGVSKARNRGIDESLGRYVAFLDADDTWDQRKLERQLSALDQNRGYHACYSAFTVGDCKLSPLELRRSKRQGTAIEDLLMRGNVVGTPSTVLCERSLIKLAGGFDPETSQCADWDMWMRLATQTDFLYLDETLVKYRQHDANMSRNAGLLERDSVRVLEKGFAMPELTERLRAGRRAAFARNYMVLAGTYFQAKLYRDFARCTARAISMDFRQAAYLMGFPLRIASRLRPKKSLGTV
jgi:glycosyltransferase involved in cell wall biosynthesis